MDLARRLQVAAAGGRVHVLLGNREVMNLTRDRRYWNAELVGELAQDEIEAERQQGFASFRSLFKSHGGGDSPPRAAF